MRIRLSRRSLAKATVALRAGIIDPGDVDSCLRQHTIKERLARWLLLARDSVQSEVLPLTQEFVAHMLGVRRSGVTVAAHTLQQAGMIGYQQGNITLLDGDALEATACECYSVVRDEFQRLLGEH